ncbi:MAG: hypothetical protein WDN44_14280 [Sphingomonas sp.]
MLIAGSAQATPTCTHLGYGSASTVKPNKLYLYFPTADDATYPEFGVGGLITSPAHRFDATELPSYTGTTAALRDAVFDVVTDDYCEFNVQVIATTTAPPTTFPRRNTVAIGTDSQITMNGRTWGQAQNVDTGDATLIDFAREWAGTYNSSNGALSGANSTLDRWARSIGGTAAHEGGHNYGLSHPDGMVVRPGEDVLTHHLMAAGSNYTDEQRAGYRRHFSDNEYSILASNVGLSVQTMWNWDFVNPNAQTAVRLRMSFLSTQASLTVAGPYTGPLSPWSAPSVNVLPGMQTYKGVSYHKFQVTWANGQAWSGGAAGTVVGGGTFHVGTGFVGVDYNTPDPIIITQVDLIDSGGAILALHPRLVDFDSGALDAADGSFAINAINFQAAPLTLSNIRVQMFPRQVSIASLVPGEQRVTDIFGLPTQPWRDARPSVREVSVSSKADVPITVAKLSDPRQVVEVVDDRVCGDRGDRTSGPDTLGCIKGINVSLFPSTTLVLAATVTDPAAKHWDRERKAYVVGPVQTQVFMQIAGRHPDLNGNKIDDYIDIATGKARDGNRDGVIDTVRGGKLRY